MSLKKPDPSYWSPYWRNPTITSFGNLFPNNYDGAFLDFWRKQITGTLNHVLDVACGNGALTWIANDLTETSGSPTRVTGTDMATIDPFSALDRDPDTTPRVQFIGSTPAERLPFADASVDLAISQYGIEYSDLDKSIAELGRVLGRHGRIAFVLHDKESVIVKGATQHLDDFRLVFHEIRLHDICVEHEEMLRTDRNLKRLRATPAYVALESRLRESFYRVQLLVRGHPAGSPVARYLHLLSQALQSQSPADAVRRRQLIAEASRGLHAHIERVEDLWLAARSSDDRERLVELVRQEGFTVSELDVLRYKDGDNFGTRFAAHRE